MPEPFRASILIFYLPLLDRAGTLQRWRNRRLSWKTLRNSWSRLLDHFSALIRLFQIPKYSSY